MACACLPIGEKGLRTWLLVLTEYTDMTYRQTPRDGIGRAYAESRGKKIKVGAPVTRLDENYRRTSGMTSWSVIYVISLWLPYVMMTMTAMRLYISDKRNGSTRLSDIKFSACLFFMRGQISRRRTQRSVWFLRDGRAIIRQVFSPFGGDIFRGVGEDRAY